MSINKRTIVRGTAAAALALMAGGLLTACDENTAATTLSACGFVIGKGGDDHESNRSVNELLRPDETVRFDGRLNEAKYFPCTTRNYAINPTSTDAQGTLLLDVRTKDGTQVKVSVTAYWAPNQSSDDALREFIAFCEGKYRCASGSPEGDGDATNFSTPGWSGMLAENMHPVLQRIAETAFREIEDTVWVEDRKDLKDKASTSMQGAFAGEMQKLTGSTVDLFCGSSGATSGQSDCPEVRIVVDKVVAADDGLQQQTQRAAAQRRQIDLEQQQAADRIRLTDQVYGPLGPLVRACQDQPQAICVLGTGEVQVQIPPR